jgi:hypothetical protein
MGPDPSDLNSTCTLSCTLSGLDTVRPSHGTIVIFFGMVDSLPPMPKKWACP